MGEVWERRCPISSSLELNLLPQNSFPCIQLQEKGEDPVGAEVEGGGAPGAS